ncbi:phosphatase PAP2 family protein [Candidatus Uabimicrobium sp. HlEnr_7]|uniref:phosphatase PAP2 family protein n=1 Tax=Candidatus Uabimicrobium helgolandensis TaxID=3095367 RepID=UPI0035562E38
MIKTFKYEYAFIVLGLISSCYGLFLRSYFALELGIFTTIYIASLFWLVRHRENKFLAKLRLALGFVFIFYIYQSIHKIVDLFSIALKDHYLLRCDEFLFGKTLSIYMEQFHSVWLTDINNLLYVLYDIYLAVFLTHCLFVQLNKAQLAAHYLFNAFFLGFVIYILVPAVGPRYAYTHLYSFEINGGVISQLISSFIENASPGYDVFPSLHTMVLLVLLDYDYHCHRFRFNFMLPFAFGILFSTLYLRYHYAIDLIAGIILFLLLKLWFEKRHGWSSYEL